MLNLLKKYKWVFLFSILVYSLWVAYWLMKANLIFVGYEVFDIHFKERLNASSFTISHAASALDSLVFFITVTVVITIVSLKRPEEEGLGRKIEYIFDGADSKSSLGGYLAQKVSNLACISTLTDRVMILTESGFSNDFIKIENNTDVQIKNIHNNHLYATDEMTYKIRADNVEIPTGLLGEVHDISMIFDAVDSKRNKRILESTRQITNHEPNFEECFSLKLNAREQVIYRTSCWLWQSLEEKLNIFNSRFTMEHNLTIRNKMKKSVKLTIQCPSKDGGKEMLSDFSQTIASKEEYILPHKNITPTDKITIMFELLNS